MALGAYDPDTAPAVKEWLELDDSERLDLVAIHHQRTQTRLPNPHLHFVIHVVVENQLALGEDVVVTTLARLQADGLSRHDGIHAIGSVFAEHLYELLDERASVKDEGYAAYLKRVKQLEAADWRGR
ncbi:MAG TPA: hypothetical protein VEY91_05995 [Candidatus Limnocylindria bacterium]|nr:hypothetical protein [Candidatus Limnocylindria bacterium]